MKILIVCAGYFPAKNYGGPPVSVNNICRLMSESYEFYIITHDHDIGEKRRLDEISDGWNDRGNCKVLYLSDKSFNYSNFKKAVHEISPDIIYLQSLFSADFTVPMLIIAKRMNIPLLLAPRGEVCDGAFRKKYKKIPYIMLLKLFGLMKNIYFQSTSDDEYFGILKRLTNDKNRIVKLNNIPSLPSEAIHVKNKIKGKSDLVFISRITPKKNLLAAIKILKSVKSEIKYDIYGPIEDVGYWNECQKAIDVLPSNIKVNYKGIIDHENIFKTFSMYDGFLFPTFSENYGHVIVEAMLSGCIPIISDRTPWSHINNADLGWAISLDNESGYVSAIEALAEYGSDKFKKISGSLKAYTYDCLKIDDIKNDYNTFFKKVISK